MLGGGRRGSVVEQRLGGSLAPTNLGGFGWSICGIIDAKVTAFEYQKLDFVGISDVDAGAQR